MTRSKKIRNVSLVLLLMQLGGILHPLLHHQHGSMLDADRVEFTSHDCGAVELHRETGSLHECAICSRSQQNAISATATTCPHRDPAVSIRSDVLSGDLIMFLNRSARDRAPPHV